MEFLGSFKDVLRKFQMYLKKVSQKIVAWISSQLPKQKEGLFIYLGFLYFEKYNNCLNISFVPFVNSSNIIATILDNNLCMGAMT